MKQENKTSKTDNMKAFISLNNSLRILLIFIFISFSSCADLEVLNTNDIGTDDLVKDPQEIKNLAGSQFNVWFYAEQHNNNSPGPAMWVMADWGTVTFANYATKDLSEEPRIFMNNTPTYFYRNVTNIFWRKMYSALTSSNTVIKAIEDGIEIGNENETMMVKGMAYFMQGISNGYIGLVFDKAYPSDENTDYVTIERTDYKESINIGIAQLEKAIEIFDNYTFDTPEEWMTKSYSNTYMSQLAHSFIARLMVYSPRNTAQTDAVDWAKVLEHAQAGISEDFAVEGDGLGNTWMSWYKYYLARPDWGKVDMRVIHMMDNTQPANWPEAGIDVLPFNGVMDSQDNRAYTDFEYNTANSRPERGKYRWSSHRYKRMDEYIQNDFFAPIVLMRKAENDLFMAEALARLNRYPEAATIINAGTRTTRGNLPNISNDAEAVNEAIFYERTIELPLTGMGIEFFDMRRHGLLQDGSLLHFPIPAQQLEIIEEPFYTYGGIDPQYGVPSEDVSVGGWYHVETTK